MRVVILGGGSGTSHLLSSLKAQPNWEVSAIISISDDGGSSGVFRREYGVPALGDIRKNLSSLSSDMWMESRFSSGFLQGHPIGNIFLSSLVLEHGLDEGINRAHDILRIDPAYRIIPNTLTVHDLALVSADGEHVQGECSILRSSALAKPFRFMLLPEAQANKKAIVALSQADVIIVGPGLFYTSIIACLLPGGLIDTLRSTRAHTVFIANLANYPDRHCQGYSVQTYLDELQLHLGWNDFDTIFAHDTTGIPASQIIPIDVAGERIIIDNFLSHDTPQVQSRFDTIPRNTLRHDTKKVIEHLTQVLA